MADKTSRRKISNPYTSAPYVRSRVTTGDIMYVVVLALLPCAGVGMYHYGFHAALLIGVSVGTAIAAELVCDLVRRNGSSIFDYSCVVTGLIGGLILPPAVPLWIAAVQSLLAIVVFKHLFGGLGRNLFNPAMAARLVLTVACYEVMTDYGNFQYTEAAPLTLLQNGETPDLVSMLTGNAAGCIGTASALAVLITAVILLVTGIIDLYVPVSAVLSFMVLYAVFGEYGLSLYTQFVQLCGGSFLFTVIIMAGDYTTSPVSERARVAYGALLGTLIFVFRQLGFVEEAFIGSLLAANAVRPFLDRTMAPRPFGATAARWMVREPKRRPSAEEPAEYEPAGEDAQAPAAAAAAEQDLEFARLQEQLRPKTQGLETGRYAGNAPFLQDAMSASGMEMEYSPADTDEDLPDENAKTQQLSAETIEGVLLQGEYEAVVTDTSSIRPEVIRATIDEEGRVGGSWYSGAGALPPMPKPPVFGPLPGPGRSTAAAPPETAAGTGPSEAPEGPGTKRSAQGSVSPVPGADGSSASEEGASPARTPDDAPKPVRTPAQEPVTRHTDMWEVQEILRAEREIRRTNDEEFAGIEFIDLSRSSELRNLTAPKPAAHGRAERRAGKRRKDGSAPSGAGRTSKSAGTQKDSSNRRVRNKT